MLKPTDVKPTDVKQIERSEDHEIHIYTIDAIDAALGQINRVSVGVTHRLFPLDTLQC
jgi:hypothetical protein